MSAPDSGELRTLVRVAGKEAGEGAGGIGAIHAAIATRALSETPRGAVLLGVLNGLHGDALEHEGSPLQQPLALRVGGAPVPPEPEALAAAYPGPSGTLVVFVHGLME